MRLLALKDLEEGMCVTHPLYGINNEILVKEKAPLTKKVISKLESLGWNYLYVDDDYSQDISSSILVAPQTKSKAIFRLKKLTEYIGITADEDHKINLMSKELQGMYDSCMESVQELIDDLMTDNITLVDVYDVKMIANYQYAHSINVLIISIVIGKALGFNQLELKELGMAAYFHDLGIAFLPESIKNNNGKYTDEDFLAMRQHSEHGYRFVKEHFHMPLKSYVAILQHHERYDGTGYPLGKEGEEITLYARILAVADVYDALTTDKPYREAMAPLTAFKYIIKNNKKVFDPKIVQLFYKKVSAYPLGFTLHLPDGRYGIVSKNIEGQPLFPEVKIIKYKDVDIVVPYRTILEHEQKPTN